MAIAIVGVTNLASASSGTTQVSIQWHLDDGTRAGSFTLDVVNGASGMAFVTNLGTALATEITNASGQTVTIAELRGSWGAA